MPHYPLLFITKAPETVRCKGTGGGEANYPPRDPQAHSQRISRLFEEAWASSNRASTQRVCVALPAKKGVYLEVKGAAGHDLATQSLDSRRDGYTLLNVRQVDEENSITSIATIFIPEESKLKFVEKIRKYAEEKTPRGNPCHADLIGGIEEISLAVLDDFWTDDQAAIPQEVPIWCEIWLRDDPSKEAFSRFAAHATELGIEYNTESRLNFPERTVALARISRETFYQLLLHSPDIAECRLAREPAEFFTEMSPREQADWVTDFLQLARFNPSPQISVCILDTGVNKGHPLLSSILSDNDMHAADPTWGTHDHDGHGTGMAGIAAYGNVAEALAAPQGVTVMHCLESSKVRPPQNDLPPELYGFVTAQCVTLAETAAPQRKRQICMAVTAESPFAHRGEPTSWSSAIDSLAAGVDGDPKRLILLSAGNTAQDEYSLYPDSNLTQAVEDPAQSWNALTVGAYTELIQSPLDYTTLADKGQLSPFSRTSGIWQKQWPAKPDIVFEGGNACTDASGFCGTHEALSVLTTSHRIPAVLFKSFCETSAATAEAAWFAAQIQARYPEAWPETVRALMVHSAEWTPAMRNQFTINGNKTELARLRRICGYGVPSLERALHCMGNSLVLVVEQELQLYRFLDENGRLKDGMQMHLFEIPWPVDALRDLGEQKVVMRITLSYFIEPSPSQRGWKDKYRYASHGLRFDVCGPQESQEAFVARISKVVEEEESERPVATETSGRWAIGSKGRSAGSIHSDFWEGTAAEIASCNHIAVYPVVGWWRKRTHLNKADSKARYSLVVSLHTEAQGVDIYTPVTVQIDSAIKTPVIISTS